MIAPVYMRLGRFDDAVEARKKSLALNGESATRQADLGEAMTRRRDGVVTAEAKAAFERAVARDPHEPKARYFLGLAAEQDGKSAEAASDLAVACWPMRRPARRGLNSCARRSARAAAAAQSCRRPQDASSAGRMCVAAPT